MASTTVDTLNGLLRGEIAATETYQQALDICGDDPEGAELRRIHGEHREAANMLRQHVHQFGGQPDQGSGTWGAFAKAVEGTAKIFGNTAAMSALKQGEEQGEDDYEDALEDKDVAPEIRALIQTTLLPRTREHIQTLDRLMESR